MCPIDNTKINRKYSVCHYSSNANEQTANSEEEKTKQKIYIELIFCRRFFSIHSFSTFKQFLKLKLFCCRRVENSIRAKRLLCNEKNEERNVCHKERICLFDIAHWYVLARWMKGFIYSSFVWGKVHKSIDKIDMTFFERKVYRVRFETGNCVSRARSLARSHSKTRNPDTHLVAIASNVIDEKWKRKTGRKKI